jgi:hypothetical protein
MRHYLDSALAPVRRFRPVAQDGAASFVLCLLVIALIFEATPPRFLLGPLLKFATPTADTYSATARRVVAGSPELDDAPGVEVAADVVVSAHWPTVQGEDRGKKTGKGKTVAATDGSDGGGGGPTTSSGPTTPSAPSPIGPCRGNASTNSTKHASSSGLRNGTGHGCA